MKIIIALRKLNMILFSLFRTSIRGLRSSSGTLHTRKLLIYMIYGWGAPIIVITISLALHYAPDGSLHSSIVRPEYAVAGCTLIRKKLKQSLLIYIYVYIESKVK